MQKFNLIYILSLFFYLKNTNCSCACLLCAPSDKDFSVKSSEWNFKKYIKSTMKCIRIQTNDNFCVLETKLMLKYIWKHISQDKNELAIFMSSALHNTSCFVIMEVLNDKNLYECKGLLQIQGKENYELLTKLSKEDYLLNPYLIAQKTESAIKDTGLFWKSLMSEKKMTWKDSMDALRIESWIKYSQCKTIGKYPVDVEKRYEIYEVLRKLYD